MKCATGMICAVTAGLLFTGCDRQQELCFNPDEHFRQPVEVVFDWSLHPDADPATMSLYLFPKNGGNSFRYEFACREGGSIMVPVGEYTAIALNSDSETFRIEGTESLTSIRVRLRDAYELQGLSIRSADMPRPFGTEDERMAAASSQLWRARVDNITVSGDSQSADTLVLKPADAVCHYSVTITSVENLAGVKSVSATVTGMASAMRLHDSSLSDEFVTIPFDVSPADPTSLAGRWMTFGHCGQSRDSRDSDSGSALHQFTVYAILTDGSRWYHTYDITEQIHSSATGDCDIVVDGLRLPEAMAGGGFDISVGGWQTVPEYIQM